MNFRGIGFFRWFLMYGKLYGRNIWFVSYWIKSFRWILLFRNDIGG